MARPLKHDKKLTKTLRLSPDVIEYLNNNYANKAGPYIERLIKQDAALKWVEGNSDERAPAGAQQGTIDGDTN